MKRAQPLALTLGACAGAGYALALGTMLPALTPVTAPAAPVRVSIRASAPSESAQAQAETRLPLQTDAAPQRKQRTAPKQASRKRHVREAAPAPAQSEAAPPESTRALPETAPETTPGMPSGNAPDNDAPVLPWADAPGGDVLVLGLLIDETGLVLDTRVLVASRHALEDLTFALAMRGQRFSRVEPALAPGQTRWVPARIPYRTDALLP